MRVDSCSSSSPATILKRKRRALNGLKIEIPNVLREIQETYSSTTGTNCSNSTPLQDVSFTANDGAAAVFSIKGGRKRCNEDSHKILSFSHYNINKEFFGVYDGHGGSMAAEFVSENLHTNILKKLEDRSESNATIEEAVKEGYLKTDQDFLKQGLGSGTCCVTALIQEKDVIISNIGDCRAVLCRGGMAEALTKDHRADQEDEMERIENTGGYVGNHGGRWRVNGILAVSRSIGDSHLKKWVVAEPDTKILQLDPDMDFLLLASDGLWDKVGNQEAVDKVKQICLDGNKLESSGDLCEESNGSENGIVCTSPSSKLKRVSLIKPQKTKTVDSANRNDCSSPSPPLWLRRLSLFKSPKAAHPNNKKTDDEFASENASPPSKARRITLFDRENLKTCSTHDENSGCMKKPANGGGLVDACKELTNLAVKKAESLGLQHLSAHLDSVGSNFSHGVNFATAGSTIRPPNQTISQSGSSPISLDVQFVQFSDFHRRSQHFVKQGGIFVQLLPKGKDFGRALYTFDIGQNDIVAGYKLNMTTDQVKAYVPDLLNQLSNVVKHIYGQGGRSFWIHNTGPAGCLPYILVRFLITAAQIDRFGCATPFNGEAQYFNAKLKEAVVQLRKDLLLASITYVDVYSIKYQLISHANKHGFEHPLRACCGHGGKYNYNRYEKCGTKITVKGKEKRQLEEKVVSNSSKDLSVRVSWDGVHFTEAANKWVFDQIMSGSFTDPPISLRQACHRMNDN